MSRLWNAGAARLRKNKVYWITVAVALGYTAMVLIVQYYDMCKYGEEYTLDPIVFNFLPLVGILMAVFVSLFVGTEYSGGTIRNKLIVGLSRKNIYLTNLIVCVVGGTFLVVVTYLFALVCGIPLFGLPKLPVGKFLQFGLIGILTCMACVSLYNLIAMNLSSKTSAAVVCILLAFAMLFFSSFLFAALNQPEYIEQFVKKGEEVMMETVKNPSYLTGLKREIYQHLMDFLPSGQILELLNSSFVSLNRMMLYSLLVTFGSTAAGLVCFEKKDIK